MPFVFIRLSYMKFHVDSPPFNTNKKPPVSGGWMSKNSTIHPPLGGRHHAHHGVVLFIHGFFNV